MFDISNKNLTFVRNIKHYEANEIYFTTAS